MPDWRRKAALSGLVALFVALAPFFVFELFYRYELRDVALEPLPRTNAPWLFENAVWTALEEHRGAQVERVGFGDHLRVLIGAGKPLMQLPAGFRAAAECARHVAPPKALKRWAMAIYLSRHVSEEPLRGAVAATAYFGRHALGVDAASWAYFGRPAANLTLGEQVTVAAQLWRPHRDPFCDAVGAHVRRGELLSKMLADHLITNEAAAAALAEEVRVTPIDCTTTR